MEEGEEFLFLTLGYDEGEEVQHGGRRGIARLNPCQIDVVSIPKTNENFCLLQTSTGGSVSIQSGMKRQRCCQLLLALLKSLSLCWINVFWNYPNFVNKCLLWSS